MTSANTRAADAAMVFQHGRSVDDFAKAYELAFKAATLAPSDGQAWWLAAAARDREAPLRRRAPCGLPPRCTALFNGKDKQVEVGPVRHRPLTAVG